MRESSRLQQITLLLVIAGALVAVPAIGTAHSVSENGDPDTVMFDRLLIEPDTAQQQESDETTADCIETADVGDNIPENRDEFLGAFRRLNGSEAFSRYAEFEIVRSQALLNVQAGTFTEKDRRRFDRVIRLLRTFKQAYSCQQDGQFTSALTVANETNKIADALATGGSGQFGALADLALTRFHTRVGEALRARGNEINRTPDRIASLEAAALAFRRAGATDRFAQLSARLNQLQQTYQADMKSYNESVETAESFINKCSSCDTPQGVIRTFGAGVFKQYIDARTAAAESTTAVSLAEKHSLQESVERTTVLRARIESARGTVAIAATGVMIGFALVTGLVGALFGNRVAAWRRDLEDSQVGNVVLIGEMLDA